MEIKASSKMDLASCKAFFQATNKAYTDRRMIFQGVWSVILEILLLVSYFASANMDNELIRKVSLPLLIIFPILQLFAVTMYFYLPKQTHKMLGDYKDGINSFVFNETDFTEVSTTPDGQKSKSSTVNYSDVLKTIETDKYIFIYINIRQAYIVEKETIDKDKIGDIRAKLSDKKYIFK